MFDAEDMSSGGGMVDVFLSYAQADRAAAERLAEALKRIGLRVFWDSTLLPGDNYERTVAEYLRSADAVVVLSSHASGRSQVVHQEAQVALQNGKLLVVRIDDAPLPIPYRDQVALDFSRWRGDTDTREFEELVRGVRELSRRRRLADQIGDERAGAPPPDAKSAGSDEVVDADFEELPARASAPPSAPPAPSRSASSAERFSKIERRRDDAERTASFGVAGRAAWDDAMRHVQPASARPASTSVTRARGGWATSVGLGLGLLGAGVAIGAYRDEIAQAIQAFIGLLTGGAGASGVYNGVAPPAGPRPPDAQPLDRVTASLFAPRECPRGDAIRVQIALHRSEDADAARADALEADPDAKRHGASRLSGEIARGSQITVRLIAPQDGTDGAPAPLKIVRSATERFEWDGERQAATFVLRADEAAKLGSADLAAMVFVDNRPVGSFAFILRVVEKETAGPTNNDVVAPRARAYKKVFISYAREDERDAALVNASYQAVSQETFWDLNSIRGGEEWRPRLEREVKAADLVLLLWSDASRRSDMVRQEARWALETAEARGAPDLWPVALTARMPDPWPEIAHLNIERLRLTAA